MKDVVGIIRQARKLYSLFYIFSPFCALSAILNIQTFTFSYSKIHSKTITMQIKIILRARSIALFISTQA
jgi:hypothetical protein